MRVIFRTADDDRRTLQGFGNSAKICVERLAGDFVAQPWAAFLGGKDKVNINGRERLRHKVGVRLTIGPSNRNPESIPKGLCPPAQGCEERATLGKWR